ncbi:MAG: ribonuclease J [Chloroflexota bacterium]
MPQESEEGGRTRRRGAATPAKTANRGDQAKKTRRLRLIPLGGVGEVGKNCLLLEQGSDLVLIDVGVKFPEVELLGIDLIIPDLRYVAERVQQLRGIVITHGHEDHLGALPYVLRQLNSAYPVPVYGSRLVLGMARAKLEEHRALDLCDLQEIDFGTKLHLGSVRIEFFPVGHSIPDASGLIIETAFGTIVHTSDFKFGEMPQAGLDRLRAVAQHGVQLLLSDTVRIESPEPTRSEAEVAQTIRDIMAAASGRVFVTTFASNLARVDSVMQAAHKLGRHVAVAGRSIDRNLGIAREEGYIKVPDDLLVSLDRAEKLPANQVVLLTTGSQGEPTSALGRMAVGEHRLLRVRQGDTIILSSSPIPGNEQTVSSTIDNLFRAGALVHYSPITPALHASGHASRREIGQMMDLIKPAYAVPMHGEYRMMVLFRQLAGEHGIPADHVLLPEIGRAIDVTQDGARLGGTVESGSVLVDGLTVGAIDHVVLRDRRALASDGIMVISAAIDRTTGRLVRAPEILARGVLPAEDGQFLEEAVQRIERALRRGEPGELEYRIVGDRMKESLAGFVFQRTRLRPMILPVITEV